MPPGSTSNSSPCPRSLDYSSSRLDLACRRLHLYHHQTYLPNWRDLACHLLLVRGLCLSNHQHRLLPCFFPLLPFAQLHAWPSQGLSSSPRFHHCLQIQCLSDMLLHFLARRPLQTLPILISTMLLCTSGLMRRRS